MSSPPLVSIIINNYDYGRFLRESIDSALGQTYDNVEVIVVDDGSTDDSRDIIESYGSRIISVFKENGGQGSAYNAGFLKCHGQIVCNLDADDTLLPEAMETIIPLFERDNTIKVQWPLWVVDRDGIQTKEITTKWTPPEGNLREFVVKNGPFYDFNLHVGSAVRRTFLDNVLPMPEAPYINGGDVYLTTLAPIYGEICNCVEPLGTYRVHGSNNYCGQVLNEARIHNYITRFETNSEALSKHLQNLGIKVDKELWKKRNFNYLWPTRLLLAKQDIQKHIPEGDKYILVNEEEWGEGEHVPNRHAIPFLERDGQYGGPPADDAIAIKELERLRKTGVNYIVFWWTKYWWFDNYYEFYIYLKGRYSCVLNNESLVVFNLTRN